MSQNALKKIESFDEAELKTFLKLNGLNAYSRIFDLEEINGKTFLNLTKYDFIRWRKLVPEAEIREVKKFLKAVKENPQRFLKEDSKVAPPSSERHTEKPSRKSSSYRKELEKLLANKANTIDKRKDVKESIEQQTTNLEENNLEINQTVLLERSHSTKNSFFYHKEQPTLPTLPPIPPRPYKRRNGLIESSDKQEPVELTNVYESRYFLNINRMEAETFLKTTARDGAYLFRPSTQHHCALSVLYENDVRHFGVKLTEGNKLEFVSIGNDIQFNSLEEIVNYFNRYPALQTANTQQIIKLSNHVLIK